MEPIEVDVTFHVDDRDVMAKMGVAYAPLAARDYVLREMAACPEVRTSLKDSSALHQIPYFSSHFACYPPYPTPSPN